MAVYLLFLALAARLILRRLPKANEEDGSRRGDLKQAHQVALALDFERLHHEILLVSVQHTIVPVQLHVSVTLGVDR